MTIDAYNSTVEMKHRDMYNLSSMISGFVNLALAGKEIPKYEDIFEDNAKEKSAESEKQQMNLYIDQWKCFADRINIQNR